MAIPTWECPNGHPLDPHRDSRFCTLCGSPIGAVESQWTGLPQDPSTTSPDLPRRRSGRRRIAIAAALAGVLAVSTGALIYWQLTQPTTPVPFPVADAAARTIDLPGPVIDVDLSADGSTAYALTWTDEVEILAVDLDSAGTSPLVSLSEVSGEMAIASLPDGAGLVVADSLGVRVYEISSGAGMQRIDYPELTDLVIDLAISESGSVVYVLAQGGTLSVVDLDTSQVETIDVSGRGMGVRFDSPIYVSGLDEVRALDPDSYDFLDPLPLNGFGLWLDVGPDGTVYASSDPAALTALSPGGEALWQTQVARGRVAVDRAGSVLFLSSHNLEVISRDKGEDGAVQVAPETLYMIDTEAGAILREFSVGTAPNEMALTPDNERLVVTSGDGFLTVIESEAP